jgi:hypothetical protein
MGLLVLSGCASKLPMAIDSETQTLDLSDKSVLLLMVDIERKEESRFKPTPNFMVIGKLDSDGNSVDRKIQNVDDDGEFEISDDKTRYLFRIPAAEGTASLPHIYGQARAFPIIGQFSLPVGMDVPVKNGSVIYLGRLEAVLRPREDNEYRAGPVIPLLDQSLSGMSGGTFDIKLVDRSDEDLPLIRKAYPVLANTPIETRLLPIPDRDFLDRQWAGEDMTGIDPYKGSRKAEAETTK